MRCSNQCRFVALGACLYIAAALHFMLLWTHGIVSPQNLIGSSLHLLAHRRGSSKLPAKPNAHMYSGHNTNNSVVVEGHGMQKPKHGRVRSAPARNASSVNAPSVGTLKAAGAAAAPGAGSVKAPKANDAPGTSSVGPEVLLWVRVVLPLRWWNPDEPKEVIATVQVSNTDTVRSRLGRAPRQAAS